tara:strand:+ start:67 stop:441 length:375 start_codon:yes stop_codon:yes gene_type:complete
MANPNIVAVTTILGTTTFLTPANTTANVLLSNAASSGLVFKVNNIVCANVTGSAANVTVSIDNAAAGAGTDFPIVSAVSVPANASLIAVDKTTCFYLMENQSIVVTSGTSSAISYTISYESIAS